MRLRLLRLSIILFLCLAFNTLHAQVPIKLYVGASAGGSGLAGIPLQLKFSKYVALDLGVYLRTVHVDEFEDQWFVGPAADIGVNIFVYHNEKLEKFKVVDHGLYIKGAYGLHKQGDFETIRIQERSVSLGWVVEMSKPENADRFIQLQLGPSLIERGEGFLNTRYPPGDQLQSSNRILPMVYFRLSWFFLVDKK